MQSEATELSDISSVWIASIIFLALFMFDTWVKALGWSALLHLVVIAVLWYTQQPLPVAELAKPETIEAFVYQPIPRPAKPLLIDPPEKALTAAQKTAPDPVSPSTMAQSSVTQSALATSIIEPSIVEPPTVANPQPTAPQPASKVQTQPEVSAEPPRSATQKTAHATATSDAPSDDIHTDATHATKPIQVTGSPMSLAERSLAIATRHQAEVSSAALTASQQRPDLRDRPATTHKTQIKPAHAAANVLMQLSDGSFIEKVGDYCYLAKPGADLRADISSMKPFPCGEDKNAAMYERIMSKVGQNR